MKDSQSLKKKQRKNKTESSAHSLLNLPEFHDTKHGSVNLLRNVNGIGPLFYPANINIAFPGSFVDFSHLRLNITKGG